MQQARASLPRVMCPGWSMGQLFPSQKGSATYVGGKWTQESDSRKPVYKKNPNSHSWSHPTFFQQAGTCTAFSLRVSEEIHCKWLPSQGTIAKKIKKKNSGKKPGEDLQKVNEVSEKWEIKTSPRDQPGSGGESRLEERAHEFLSILSWEGGCSATSCLS